MNIYDEFRDRISRDMARFMRHAELSGLDTRALDGELRLTMQNGKLLAIHMPGQPGIEFASAAEDRWYSRDGQMWQNDARPGESIDTDPHANLTGQVIVDDEGNVLAQARSLDSHFDSGEAAKAFKKRKARPDEESE